MSDGVMCSHSGSFSRRDEAVSSRPLLAPLLLTVCLLSGCATGRTNVWPFYFQEAREVPGPDGPHTVKTVEVLGPLFSWESGPDGTWHAVRPFYNYQRWPGGERTRLQYLWPLGLHARNGQEVQHRLFPFFDYTRTWSKRLQRYSVHAHVMQLVRWGDHAEWGRYAAFIPIGGVTHGLVGRTWSFVMFPFYSRYERGHYVRHDFPWPVLGYGRSDDGTKQTYRFWPFYVFQQEDSTLGKYVRHDLMWPLIRWGRLDRGGRYYHTVLAVTPLLSRIDTYDRDGRLVARQSSVLGFGKRGKSEATGGASGWSALWSLVRSVHGRDTDEFRAFPFYWRNTFYRSAEKDPEESWTRIRAPWPIVWLDSDRMTEPGVQKRGVTVAPFYWDHTRTETSESGQSATERKTTFWPLFTWERRSDGDAHVWVVSHGWRDESQGYKRNYRALLEVFQYHHRSDGERETRVLSRLYHHRRGKHGRYLSIMGLFTYDNTAEVIGEDGTYWSALFGLVKRSSTDSGARWRVLFIPFGGKHNTSAEVSHGRNP